MIWGIFLGTAVMAFSLLLVTAVNVARIIRKKGRRAMRPLTYVTCRMVASSGC